MRRGREDGDLAPSEQWRWRFLSLSESRSDLWRRLVLLLGVDVEDLLWVLEDEDEEDLVLLEDRFSSLWGLCLLLLLLDEVDLWSEELRWRDEEEDEDDLWLLLLLLAFR